MENQIITPTIILPEGYSINDFAILVADMLKDGYGSHLYSDFTTQLNKELYPRTQPVRIYELDGTPKYTFTRVEILSDGDDVWTYDNEEDC